MCKFNSLLSWIKWFYWSGRHTKIKLIHEKEVIGYYDGYYECQSEIHNITMKYYADLKVMTHKEAFAIYELEHDKILDKYFGAKFVKQ